MGCGPRVGFGICVCLSGLFWSLGFVPVARDIKVVYVLPKQGLPEKGYEMEMGCLEGIHSGLGLS